MQAETVMAISGGEINIKSGGGSGAKISGDTSAKGIKAGTSLVLLDGTYTVTACGQSQSVTLDSIIYGSGSMGGGQGGQGGQQPGSTPPDGAPSQQGDGSGNSGSRPTPPDGDPRQNNSAQSGQKSSSQSANQNTQTA